MDNFVKLSYKLPKEKNILKVYILCLFQIEYKI